MAKYDRLTADFVRQLLDYDPKTGALTWKRRDPSMFKSGGHTAEHNCNVWNKKYAGRLAGTLNKGYFQVKMPDKVHHAHRIIWLIITGEWPKHEIDHIDGNRSNNKLSNLREATRTQNCRNLRISIRNKSGHKGVHFAKNVNKWRVSVGHKKIGLFTILEDAIVARDKAEIELFGEFTRGYKTMKDGAVD